MWVDFEWYEEHYLLGRQPKVPPADFSYWERQARYTINRKKVDIVTAPDCLKECTCEVAEYLYDQSEANKPGAIKSFSNDGYSETYVDRIKTAKEQFTDIREIIVRHLSDTALHNDFVYSGV